MWNGFKVIDSDAHHHEPMDLWDRYLEPDFRDRVPKVIGMRRNFYVYAHDDKLSPVLDAGARYPRTTTNGWRTSTASLRQWWSPDIRLEDMDRYGWDIQVILSTNGNRIMEAALKIAEVGAAMARAYHNWCHDYASADPAASSLPLLCRRRYNAMVSEARRAVEKLGAVSVRNPLLPKGKWLHEPRIRCPVAARQRSRFSHLRPWRITPFASRARFANSSDRGTFSALDHIIGFPMDNMVTMAHFIFGGVLERFPKLRLGILESNAGWANFWLPRMDDHSHGRRLILGAGLPMKPSEYVVRQCVISADPDEPGSR